MPEFSGNPPHFGDRGRVGRLRKSLFEEPDDPTGHALLGLYLSIRGLHREAIEEARLALRLDPETALAHYVLSLSLARQFPRLRKIVEAIAEADEAIRLDPLSPSFYAQLAHLYLLRHSTSLQARDASAALRAAEAGLAVDPLDVPITAFLGMALGKLGRHEEAEAAFSTALALDPDQAYVRAIYGEYLFRRGDLVRAVILLQQALRLEPLCPQHRRRLAFVRGVKWALDGIIRAASNLRLLRPGPGDARLWPGEQTLVVNWPAGLVLWLSVLSATLFLVLDAGDGSIMAFCVPLSITAVLSAAVLGRTEGLRRVAIGIVAYFSGVLWLVVTTLMFILPDRIASAPRAAWPDLRLGALIHLVRALGLLSILGMILFLIVVYVRGFFARDTNGDGSGRDAQVSAD